MATRLYPKTENHANLEILAGVPAGTMAKLNEIKALNADNPCSAERYDAIHNADENVSRLEDFLSYGWGRIHYSFVESLGFDGCGGSTNDPVKVDLILVRHGLFNVNPNLTEGLCWN